MNHFKTLLLTLTGLSMAQAALAQPQTPFQAQKMAHDLMRLNSGLLHGQKQQYSNVFGRIGSRFEMPEVNSELVRRHEQKFARESAYLTRTIKRSEPYLHHVATEVERRNMPGEIALLPFIESAFVIKAKSPVGASGLWQFMPATGKDYGLDQNHVYDGRHDVYASTDAALNYLEYLYGLFGDWSLALAAYNWGQGNVTRAIKRAESQGLLPVYENLNMPQETRNYAPKLLAWRNIVYNPAAFNVQLPHINDDAYFKAVDINTPIDTAVAARLAGISHDEFLRLNPGSNLSVFIPNAERKILLPTTSVQKFIQNYQASAPDSLSSYHVYTPSYAEKVDDVASGFGMSAAQLRQVNGLRNSTLSAGLPVLVAKNQMPVVSPEQMLQTAALEAGASFLQPSVMHTPRQVDSFGKPMAQLTAAQPEKSRTSRTPYGYSTPSVNFAAVTITPSHQVAQPVVNVTAATTSSPVQAISHIQAPSAVMTAPVTPTQQKASRSQTSSIQQPARSSDPLANLMRPRNVKVASPAVAVAQPKPVQIQAVAAAPIATIIDTAPRADLPITQTAHVNANIQDAVVQADLLAIPEAVISTSQTQTAQAPSIDDNHAANAVREAIERENAREAQEQARAAKAEAEAQKRERLLANANEHKVNSGETLYSIARTYDMQVSELLAANGLDDNTIKVGQTLKVGKAADKAIELAQAKSQPAKKKSAPNAKNAKAETKHVNYVVRKGDTLIGIAGKFNVQVNDLKKWNNTDNNLKPGQKLTLRQL